MPDFIALRINNIRKIQRKFTKPKKILLAIPNSIYYYWNQAGEVTPTKARLTSFKTPEANLPGARKGLLQTEPIDSLKFPKAHPASDIIELQ